MLRNTVANIANWHALEWMHRWKLKHSTSQALFVARAQEVLWVPPNRSMHVRFLSGTESSMERQRAEPPCFWYRPWQRWHASGASHRSSSLLIWQVTSWFSSFQHLWRQHSQFWSRQSGKWLWDPGLAPTTFVKKLKAKIVKVWQKMIINIQKSKTLCFKKKTIGMNEKLHKVARFKIITWKQRGFFFYPIMIR